MQTLVWIRMQEMRITVYKMSCVPHALPSYIISPGGTFGAAHRHSSPKVLVKPFLLIRSSFWERFFYISLYKCRLLYAPLLLWDAALVGSLLQLASPKLATKLRYLNKHQL